MSRYVYHQGLITRGIHINIKGLCVLQEIKTNSLFFIPEDNYQRDNNFYRINDFTNLSREEKEHLFNLYGKDVRGRWVCDNDVTRSGIDLSLFSFITSSELTLKQILSNLQKDINSVSPSHTAPYSDRDLL